MPNLLTRIRVMAPALKPAERRLAHYILAHPEEFLHLSSSDAALAVGIRESTVHQFVTKLGLADFSEVKLHIARESLALAVPGLEGIKSTDTPEKVIQKVISEHIASLRLSEATVDPVALGKVVDLFAVARRIYLLGLGRSAPYAIDAHNKFLRLGYPCYCFTETHIQTTAVSLATKEDVIFAITLSGKSKDLYAIFELARSNGAATVALTSFGRPPIAQVSDITLFIAPVSDRSALNPITSRLPIIALVDALWTCLAMRNLEGSLRMQKSIDQALIYREF